MGRQPFSPVLAPCGEIDLATAPELRATAIAALDDVAECLAIDLRHVTFMGAAGLNALAVVRRTALGAGKRVVVVNTPCSIARLLRLTGLGELLDQDQACMA